MRQLVALLSEIHDMPASELATPAVLRRGRTALAAPNAELYGVELFPTIPGKGAALAGALLANPPLSPEAPRLACQTMRGFYKRNGWDWTVPVPATIVRFQSEMRTGEIGLGLADWINEHSEPGAPPQQWSKSPRWKRRFPVDDPGGPHVVYQAGPVSGLSEEERSLQAALGESIAKAVAAKTAYDAATFGAEHPSIHFSPAQASDLPDYELWLRNRLIVLSQADALVLTDIGACQADFGAAMEVDLMAAQGGPVLYLKARGEEGCSRYLSARGNELDLSILEYDSPEEAGELTREWLVERSNAIEEARRQRADRTFANELLLRRLIPAYTRLKPEQQVMICGTNQLTPTLVDAALEHPAATDLILGNRLAAFCDQLGVEEVATGETLEGPFSKKPQAETLLEAARETGWDQPTVQRLWDEAMDEWESAGSVARLPYSSRTDWIERERGSN